MNWYKLLRRGKIEAWKPLLGGVTGRLGMGDGIFFESTSNGETNYIVSAWYETKESTLCMFVEKE